jgi:hypothetical protein
MSDFLSTTLDMCETIVTREVEISGTNRVNATFVRIVGDQRYVRANNSFTVFITDATGKQRYGPPAYYDMKQKRLWLQVTYFDLLDLFGRTSNGYGYDPDDLKFPMRYAVKLQVQSRSRENLGQLIVNRTIMSGDIVHDCGAEPELPGPDVNPGLAEPECLPPTAPPLSEQTIATPCSSGQANASLPLGFGRPTA